MNLPFVREIPRHVPTRASTARPRLRLVPPVLGAGALLGALTFGGACFCAPDPPRMETCDDPSTDWSGITGITIEGASYRRGAQGGDHFEFRIVPSGTDLPSCIAYQAALEVFGGGTTGESGLVRADEDGSRTIYLFNPPYGTDMGAELTVTALGFTETVSTGRPLDAGTMDTGIAEPDAGDDDAGEHDAGEPDAGEPDTGESDAGDDDAGDEDAGDDDAGDVDAG